MSDKIFIKSLVVRHSIEHKSVFFQQSTRICFYPFHTGLARRPGAVHLKFLTSRAMAPTSSVAEEKSSGAEDVGSKIRYADVCLV